MTSELKVGVFTTVALVVLGYMIIVTGSCGDWFRKPEGFRATALFASIAGLEKKAAVRIAGVRVGEVSEIRLTPQGFAEVSLLISEEMQLHADATAAVSSLGLMGEKYVEIFPGSESAPLMGEGAVIRGKEPLSIDQMGAQILSISTDIKALTSSLSTVLGSEEGQARLKSIVTNFAEFSDELRKLVAENRGSIGTLITDASGLSKDLRGDLGRLTDRVDKLLTTVQAMLDENRENVHTSTSELAKLAQKLQQTSDSLNSILKKIDEGQGTIGKLVNEPGMHEKLNKALDQLDTSLQSVSSAVDKVGMPKTAMGMRTEYHATADRAKTYLSLGLNPKGKKYFLVELVHDPMSTKEEITTVTAQDGRTETRTETVAENLSITAHGGLHFGPVGIRGGLTESGAGVGLDYAFANDRFKVTVDGYDFGRPSQLNLKVGARVGLYDRVYLTFGGDDLLLSEKQQFFVGVGIGAK